MASASDVRSWVQFMLIANLVCGRQLISPEVVARQHSECHLSSCHLVHYSLDVFGPDSVRRAYRASSWVSAAAGNSLGVLDWFWAYKLAGHAHCIGWRPLRTALLFFSLASVPIPLTCNSVRCSCMADCEVRTSVEQQRCSSIHEHTMLCQSQRASSPLQGLPNHGMVDCQR